MPLTLDQRIRKDLEDLLYNHEISAALELNRSNVLKEPVSTKGLPGYFTGDRKAKTVMVMLNPKQNAEEADWDYRCQVYKLFIDDQHGPNVFFNTYIDAMTNYGRIDKHRAEPFDLKQAYFLWDWSYCKIDFPKVFPVGCDMENRREIELTAKKNVLMQKLQLELVPYCSSTFGIYKRKKLYLLMPYLETIFDEIFSYERKYVIFCSNVCEFLFDRYNKWKQRAFFINMGIKTPVPTSIGYCTKVNIKRNNDEKEVLAIIAHTFPKRNLARDANRMREYGKACFDHFNTKR